MFINKVHSAVALELTALALVNGVSPVSKNIEALLALADPSA